jgi:hypothetical protein
MNPALPFLIAQAICGTYGMGPASPGGCVVPYPAGGGVLLQEANGTTITAPLTTGSWATPLPGRESLRQPIPAP